MKLHSQTAAVKAASPTSPTLACAGDASNVFTFFDSQKGRAAGRLSHPVAPQRAGTSSAAIAVGCDMTLWNTLRSVAAYWHAAFILAAKGKTTIEAFVTTVETIETTAETIETTVETTETTVELINDYRW